MTLIAKPAVLWQECIQLRLELVLGIHQGFDCFASPTISWLPDTTNDIRRMRLQGFSDLRRALSTLTGASQRLGTSTIPAAETYRGLTINKPDPRVCPMAPLGGAIGNSLDQGPAPHRLPTDQTDVEYTRVTESMRLNPQ